MDKTNGSVNYDIIEGPDICRIVDAFKYNDLGGGGSIDLVFRLVESEIQPSGGYCFNIENLGTDKAIADSNFRIESIRLVTRDLMIGERLEQEKIVNIMGDCDLFYLDKYGATCFDTDSLNVPRAAYHVDFVIQYDMEARKGKMVCSNYRGCLYDPYED